MADRSVQVKIASPYLAAVGAGVGYLLQPSIDSVVEGAIIGALFPVLVVLGVMAVLGLVLVLAAVVEHFDNRRRRKRNEKRLAARRNLP